MDSNSNPNPNPNPNASIVPNEIETEEQIPIPSLTVRSSSQPVGEQVSTTIAHRLSGRIFTPTTSISSFPSTSKKRRRQTVQNECLSEDSASHEFNPLSDSSSSLTESFEAEKESKPAE